MITALGTVNLFVEDQERAKDFYTNKLGFEVRNDATLDGFRWLTVAPRGQRNPEFLLAVPQPPMFSPEDAANLRALLAKGAMPGGVLLRDDSGNWFSLTQPFDASRTRPEPTAATA